MSLAPILLFVYNRPSHTRQTVEALMNNHLAKESELYVFCDGSKPDSDTKYGVAQVRKIVRAIDGFKTIHIRESETNNGLAKSIIEGVSEIMHQHGKVIVVEDDLVTSPWFLTFMNDALVAYENTPQVGHIQGYMYPIESPNEAFTTQWIGSWGWATWQRAWQHFNPNCSELMAKLKSQRLTRRFDFDRSYPYTRMLQRQIDGQNNSWAIRWYASLFLEGMLSVNAGRSLVKNIGMDGSGTHCADDNLWSTTLHTEKLQPAISSTREDMTMRKAIKRYYNQTNGFWAKVKRRLNRYLRKR